MRIGSSARKWLAKKAKRGMQGFPLGTLAFYGPDDRRASKVGNDAEDSLSNLRRFFSETGDVRSDPAVLDEVAAFLRGNGVRSVAMVDRIIGCPHEEGIDYPMGEACPQCPFWAGRDRWTGEIEAL